jgi:hypothetical protein
VEFALTAVRVRPRSGELFYRLVSDLAASADFRATARRVVVARLAAPDCSRWLMYRLFQNGLFTLADVKDILDGPIGPFDPIGIADLQNWFGTDLMAAYGADGFQLLQNPVSADPAVRPAGFDMDPVIRALREDDAVALEALLAATDIDFTAPLPLFPFDRSQLQKLSLHCAAPSLAAVPAYYGSVNCIKALAMRGVSFEPVVDLACASGNAEAIRLVGGPGLHAPEVAIIHHCNAVFAWLAELGVPCNAERLLGFSEDTRISLFEHATRAGNLEIALSFALMGLNSRFRSRLTIESLLAVIQRGDTEMTRLMVGELGVAWRELSVNDPPIAVAARYGFTDIVVILARLEDTQVAALDSTGRRAIQWAIVWKDRTMIRAINARLKVEEAIIAHQEMTPEDVAFWTQALDNINEQNA